MVARVLKSTGSWYELITVEGKRINARASGRLRLQNKRLTNPIAVGDYVEIEGETEDEHLIIEIKERQNYLLRASNKLSSKYQILAANIDQVLILASLVKPFTPGGFIDRVLVSAESFRIPSIIIFNKSDLYAEKEMEIFLKLKKKYERIGYPCMLISIKNEGAHTIENLIRGKTSVIAGNSGVGKSSLINALGGKEIQRTAEVSNVHQKGGKHTTTFAEMIPIDVDSMLIDTPGIRDFGIADMQAEHIAHYFPEMRELMNVCRFGNCRHLNEPGCAVKLAVEKGKIDWDRYRVYCEIMSEIAE